MKLKKKVREKYKELIPIVDLENFGASGERENCGAGWRSIAMGPDLCVRQCVMADPERDAFGRIDASDPVQFFKNVGSVTKFYSELIPPSKEICGNCKFLNFCTPCLLRTRIIIEDNLFHRKECKFLEVNERIPIKINQNGK